MKNIADKMFSWMNKEEGRKVGDVYESVTEGLKNIYKQKLLPLEKEYQFHDFHSPALDEPDFDAKYVLFNLPRQSLQLLMTQEFNSENEV